MTGYVTTGRAAAEIGVSASTLRNWVKAGLVKPAFRTRHRGDMRWDLDDLNRQLRNQPPADHERSDRPAKPTIVASIVTSAKGVLLTQRRDGKPPWGFLTGEIEPGESPADAAVRECKEEANLRIKAGDIIAERIHPRSGYPTVYMAAVPAGSTTVEVGDPDELLSVRWVNLAEADKLTEPFGGIFSPVRDHLAYVLRGQRAAR